MLKKLRPLLGFMGALACGLTIEVLHAQAQKGSPIILFDLHPISSSTGTKFVFVNYVAYDVGFSIDAVQPAWVGYRLSRKHIGGGAERANKFQREPRLAGRDASDRDYAGSGFDKGHLVPAADMAWSVRTMEESFSYANVSPQRPGFNRGIWKRLETQIRDWAAALMEKDTIGLLIWSGPVLYGHFTLSQFGRLQIPEAFYKVIYHPKEERVAAFLLPHYSSKASLEGYLISVDSLEKVTGMDFLRGLPDEEEERLESSLCRTCWIWSSRVSSSSRKPSGKQSARSDARVCAGTTKTGKPCLNVTRDPSGYCHHHR